MLGEKIEMPRDGRMPPPRFPCSAHTVTTYAIGYEAATAKAAFWSSAKVESLMALLLSTAGGNEWDWGVIDGLADILIERGAVDTINWQFCSRG